MMREMNYSVDLHTHTGASGHGSQATITDMAKEAASRGIRLLGITDHGPATRGSATASYFRGLHHAGRKRFGIRLLLGAEANILDAEGHLDLEDEILENLDFVIVSQHIANYKPGSSEENTAAMLRAMDHPKVRVIGHADDPRYPLDYWALAQRAGEKGILLEINECSLSPEGYRGDVRRNYEDMLAVCEREDLSLILSSDSHGTEKIGRFPYAEKLLEEFGFPNELVLNNQPERILRLFDL